jgi:hypothetical protein
MFKLFVGVVLASGFSIGVPLGEVLYFLLMRDVCPVP